MSDNPDKPQYRIGSGDNQPSRVIAWTHGELNVKTIHIVISDSTSPTAQPHLSVVWHWSALSRRQWRCLDLLLSRLLWKRKD